MTVSDKSGGENNIPGPTGFLELGGNVLVVDYGNVFMDGTAVGYLYEDGYLKNPGSESEDMVQWRRSMGSRAAYFVVSIPVA